MEDGRYVHGHRIDLNGKQSAALRSAIDRFKDLAARPASVLRSDPPWRNE